MLKQDAVLIVEQKMDTDERDGFQSHDELVAEVDRSIVQGSSRTQVCAASQRTPPTDFVGGCRKGSREDCQRESSLHAGPSSFPGRGNENQLRPMRGRGLGNKLGLWI